MDGRKSKLTDSLQFRLSIGTAFAIICVASIAGIFSYWWAFQEAIELQDEQLIRLSALVNQQSIVQPDPAEPIVISIADPESHFVVQWLGRASEKATGELPGLPNNIPEGLQTRLVNDVSWRLFVKTFPNGSRVAIGQQTEVRDEIANINAIDTLIPLIILIPLLLLWVAYLIRQVFSPLEKMAMQLDNSTDHHLVSLTEENLATEIAPFVMAINRLLGRVREAITQQRQFVRDAAHELRSPLTAISLQVEHLVELDLNSDVHSKLVKLHNATERTRILMEQLLTLARVQEQHTSPLIQISLKKQLREVLEYLLPLANIKQIDVHILGDDINVYSQPLDVQILFKNVIDNAIRYTRHGGQIEIFLSENNRAAELVVRDSGPGIDQSEQARVFDPFYRVAGNDQIGSGLGLSIVRSVANRLGLTVDIYNNGQAQQSGLSVRVTFPKNTLQ